MKKLVFVVLLLGILGLSFWISGDSTPARAQTQKYPDYQILVQSQKGNSDAVWNLLRNGADPNSPPAPNDKGMTALMFACWKGHDAIVKMLVDAGADVNAKGSSGATPLVFALSGGREEMVNFLLSKGAKADGLVGGKTPAIFYAMKSNNARLVESIARISSPEILNMKNKKGDTLLLSAVKANRLDLVKSLLAGKQDLEFVDKFGQTPLMYASRFGRAKMVINLLYRGADPNAKDQNGITSLEKASLSKDKETIMTLVKRGARGKKK